MADIWETTRWTVRNLEMFEVDTEDNVLAVKGAVRDPTAATS